VSALADALRAHAEANPGKIALDPCGATPLTWSRLDALVVARAAKLGGEFARARPVALQLDHGPDAVVLELALLEAGIPVLSLPGFFTAEQRTHAIRACGAQALFASSAERAEPCDVVPVALPASTARITFTSGSTGAPKGVCLSAEHMLTVARSIVDALGGEHAGRHLALLPPGILLETVAGQFATLLAGGTYLCPGQAEAGLDDPFRPDFAQMLSCPSTSQGWSRRWRRAACGCRT